MRSKEESHDYRYFPDPDLPTVELPLVRIERISAALPELPQPRAYRFTEQYSLPAYDAEVLTSERALADYFEEVAARTRDGKVASNWVMTDVLSQCKQRAYSIADFPIRPPALAQLLTRVADGTISHTAARQVFTQMLDSGRAADDIIKAEGLAQIRDTVQLSEWAAEIVAAHPSEAQRYRGGEEKLLGFFMGRLMKRSQGKADPVLASDIVRAALQKR